MEVYSIQNTDIAEGFMYVPQFEHLRIKIFCFEKRKNTKKVNSFCAFFLNFSTSFLRFVNISTYFFCSLSSLPCRRGKMKMNCAKFWLAATDPNQVWGKALPPDPDGQFIIVHGTVVALKRGIPVAIFERKGPTLRVFDETVLADALIAFAEAF